MKNSVKEQIKNNFKTMSFEDACRANESLLTEYIRIYGQRSYNSLKAYYAKHQPHVEDIADEPVITDEFEEGIVKVESDKDVEEDVQPNEDTIGDAAPATNETSEKKSQFHFVHAEKLEQNKIEELLRSGDAILDKKCIIIMTFKVNGDNDIERSIRMIVDAIGDGFESYADARTYMADHNIKNEYKKGSFKDSKSCFPIGETNIKVWSEDIDYALCAFYIERLDSDCKIEKVECANR